MVISLAAEGGLFDSFGGLPLHPLVVHLAVILLPFSALAMAVLVFVRLWRARFGWLTLAGLAVGTVAAVVAKESGEALAHRVGEPEEHARYGDILPLVAIALFIVAAGWFLLQRRADLARSASADRAVARSTTAQSETLLPRLLGLATAALAIGTIVLTVLTGHTGAQAVWSGIVTSTTNASQTNAEPTPSPSSTSSTPATTSSTSNSTTGSTSSPATSAPPATPAGYTKAAVAQHNSATSCWTIVSGNVYDLTSWIGQHPGGRERILATCGIDATAPFVAQHGTVGRAVSVLAGYKLGALTG